MALYGLSVNMLRVCQRHIQSSFRSALPACAQYCRGLSVSTSDPPKRPGGSFIRFVQGRRPEVVMKNPGMQQKDIIKLLGAEWRQMSETDKQPFVEKTAAEIAKWKQDYALYMESLNEEEKTELKAKRKQRLRSLERNRTRKMLKKLQKPKSPGNAFLLFCNDPKSADRGDASILDFTKGMAERWRRMPVEDKQVYIDEAAKRRTEYEEKLMNWEMQMIEDGHPELVRVTSRPKVAKPRKVKRAVRKVAKKSKPKTKKKTKKSKSTRTKTTKKGTRSKKSVETQTEDVSWMREE